MILHSFGNCFWNIGDIGWIPYEVVTKLFDSVVWPVINYSAPIWGYSSYSCIEAVHNRAQRFFLGVGKYAPNDGVSGDMGWKPPIVRQWKSVMLYWSRLSHMNDRRINKRIAVWAGRKSSRSCRNWSFKIKEFLDKNDFHLYCNIQTPILRCSANFVEQKVFDDYVNHWRNRINRDIGPSGNGRNKLRTYKTFKNDYVVEEHCKRILSIKHRSAFSKFRLGVAPIRIETGRYEGLIEDQRICPLKGLFVLAIVLKMNCMFFYAVLCIKT